MNSSDRREADSEYRQPSEEPCPSPARYYHLTGAVIAPSKVHSIALSNKLYQDGGEHGKPSEFQEPEFIVSRLWLFSSLVQSNAVWNTIMIDR